MEFSALIPFAVLLVPGAFVQYLCERLRPGQPTESEFMRVFHSLLFGWPVLLANWVVVRFVFKLGETLDQIMNLFNNLGFFVLWFASSLLLSLVLAVLIVWTDDARSSVILGIQRLLKQPEVVAGNEPWDQMFYSTSDQVVEVETSDGHIVKGFVKLVSYQGPEVKELTLHGFDIVDKHKEFFTNIQRVYINTDSGTIIREYDVQPYLDMVRKAQEAQQS